MVSLKSSDTSETCENMMYGVQRADLIIKVFTKLTEVLNSIVILISTFSTLTMRDTEVDTVGTREFNTSQFGPQYHPSAHNMGHCSSHAVPQ